MKLEFQNLDHKCLLFPKSAKLKKKNDINSFGLQKPFCRVKFKGGKLRNGFDHLGDILLIFTKDKVCKKKRQIEKKRLNNKNLRNWIKRLVNQLKVMSIEKEGIKIDSKFSNLIIQINSNSNQRSKKYIYIFNHNFHNLQPAEFCPPT